MLPAILGIGGLAAGLLGQGAQARQAKAQMMSRAAEQEAAPWTKQGVSTPVPAAPGSALGQGLGGALSGFQVGQSIESAGKQDEVNQALAAKLMGPPESAPFSDEDIKMMEQVKALQNMNAPSQAMGLGAATLYGRKV